MRLILVSNDLMVVSRVQGAAIRAGGTVQAVLSVAIADESLRGEAAELVIVDLGSPMRDLETFVAKWKSESSTPPRIVAFGPHVHEVRLAAARAAGCDVVLSRGQFFAQVDALLID
jgi:DNA-binding response OmpR family regulator